MSSAPSMEESAGLPIEVTEIIIDHLYDDKKSLKACSLVSPLWIPTSRFHLFQSFRFNMEQGRAKKLLQLLQESPHSSQIRRSVRRLDFFGSTYSGDDYLLSPDGLEVLGNYFSNINCITLNAVWEQLTSESTKHISRLWTITELSLAHCFLDGIDLLVELICSFPALETLRIERFRHKQAYPEPIIPPFTISPCLSRLSILSSPPSVLLWLSTQEFPQLEHLSCEIPKQGVETISTLISHTMPALKHLSLTYLDNYILDSAPRIFLDLSQNTSLQTLDIQLPIFRSYVIQQFILRSHCNFRFLRPLLASISSHYFYQAKFTMAIRDPAHLEALDLNQIDDVLSKSRCFSQNRAKVVFELSNATYSTDLTNYRPGAQKILHYGLEETARRGALQIVHI